MRDINDKKIKTKDNGRLKLVSYSQDGNHLWTPVTAEDRLRQAGIDPVSAKLGMAIMDMQDLEDYQNKKDLKEYENR